MNFKLISLIDLAKYIYASLQYNNSKNFKKSMSGITPDNLKMAIFFLEIYLWGYWMNFKWISIIDLAEYMYGSLK